MRCNVRGCNDATSASNSSKNYVVPSVCVSLDTNNPWWRGSHDSWMQNCNWSEVSCTLVASMRVASGKLPRLAMPHSRHVLCAGKAQNEFSLHRVPRTEYSTLLTLVLLSVSLAHWDTVHDARHNGACVHPAHWVTRITQVGQARSLFCPLWGSAQRSAETPSAVKDELQIFNHGSHPDRPYNDPGWRKLPAPPVMKEHTFRFAGKQLQF